MISNIMLMFLILLFLAGDVENNPGPMGTPVSETNNKSLTIFHISFKLIDTLEVFLKLLPLILW
jgi:YbbR domain-containing protein